MNKSHQELVQRELKLNEEVIVEYFGKKYKGRITRIYGNTVNVIFDGKHSAFYKGNVRKARG